MAHIEFVRPKQADKEAGWSASTRKRRIASGDLDPPLNLGPNMTGWTREYWESYKRGLVERAEAEDREAEEAGAAKTGDESEDDDEGEAA